MPRYETWGELRGVDRTGTNDDLTWRKLALRNLDARSEARGQWRLPCLPAARDHYLQRLVAWFADWGKPLQPHEVEQVRQLLGDRLAEGFRLNAGAKLVVEFDLNVTAALQKNLALKITYTLPDLAEEYTNWAGGNTQPLFGGHPDARVMKALPELTAAGPKRLLDVGAGDGRNAIPLAQMGYAVDGLELTQSLAERLRRFAAQQSVSLRVIVGDLFDRSLPLNPDGYHLVILSGVASHFRSPQQLRQWMERLSELLIQGGQGLLNVFLADEGYEPDELVRQLSQTAWSSLFTYGELRDAMSGLPLKWLSDDPVFDYERTHLPPEAWPPNPWFETWTLGRAIAPIADGRPPFQMHWIALQKL